MSNKRKQARAERRQKARQRRNLYIGLGVGLFVVILSFFTWQQVVSRSQALPPEEVTDPVLGAASAPVEIVEYGDFGCPSCRAWHNSGIRERVLTEYGDQVRFVWRDFPVITPQSPEAAEAAQCAGAQDKFWEYHDHLYESGVSLNTGSLKEVAGEIGLDQESFNACLDQGQMARKVQDNEQQARRLGLRGTPSFIVNGQVLPGPPNFEQLTTQIELALAQ